MALSIIWVHWDNRNNRLRFFGWEFLPRGRERHRSAAAGSWFATSCSTLCLKGNIWEGSNIWEVGVSDVILYHTENSIYLISIYVNTLPLSVCEHLRLDKFQTETKRRSWKIRNRTKAQESRKSQKLARSPPAIARSTEKKSTRCRYKKSTRCRHTTWIPQNIAGL